MLDRSERQIFVNAFFVNLKSFKWKWFAKPLAPSSTPCSSNLAVVPTSFKRLSNHFLGRPFFSIRSVLFKGIRIELKRIIAGRTNWGARKYQFHFVIRSLNSINGYHLQFGRRGASESEPAVALRWINLVRSLSIWKRSETASHFGCTFYLQRTNGRLNIVAASYGEALGFVVVRNVRELRLKLRVLLPKFVEFVRTDWHSSGIA